jgi:hypothetical protein
MRETRAATMTVLSDRMDERARKLVFAQGPGDRPIAFHDAPFENLANDFEFRQLRHQRSARQSKDLQPDPRAGSWGRQHVYGVMCVPIDLMGLGTFS